MAPAVLMPLLRGQLRLPSAPWVVLLGRGAGVLGAGRGMESNLGVTEN